MHPTWQRAIQAARHCCSTLRPQALSLHKCRRATDALQCGKQEGRTSFGRVQLKERAITAAPSSWAALKAASL